MNEKAILRNVVSDVASGKKTSALEAIRQVVESKAAARIQHHTKNYQIGQRNDR